MLQVIQICFSSNLSTFAVTQQGERSIRVNIMYVDVLLEYYHCKLQAGYVVAIRYVPVAAVIMPFLNIMNLYHVLGNI